ncbi:MAG: DUF2332 domain-containing protein [Alphaproteobacteria bacterium]|nr:DUF2332 domain-containing protein [Alphaproteobacteria bacterium]MCW5739986.1 DUF2332 domain-containing protein [Alphaproteobacteria bacterium]
MDDQERHRLAARYLRFAEEEARGRSPLYEGITRGIVGDIEVLNFLAGLPEAKRQPNLLLAAVRHLHGMAPDWQRFRASLLGDSDAVRALMLARSTQTNEPARSAVLLPILARLPQPIALIEVGASAGLCLLPDFYGYDYGRRALAPRPLPIEAPVFACQADADTPLPEALPFIVWRAGLDLEPIDAADRAQAAWLETLVWPEQSERLDRLRRALKIAALQKPRIERGDLLGEKLTELCALAPKSATLVVFHTAVLGYVADRAARQRFAATVRTLCPCWIANESPRVFAEHAEGAGEPPRAGDFLMAVNGAPVAWTDPHGASLRWIADPAL